MDKEFAIIVNTLWKKCIKNLNTLLSEEEAAKFSNNDYYYLMIIESLGQANFTEIAETLQVTKPAVSAIIKKLSRLGLVEKIQSEVDKRISYVQITPKGKSILEGDVKIYSSIVDLIRNIVKNKEEYEIIERVIKELANIIELKEEL